MYKVQLTPQAVEDLQDIKSYISDELKNPIAAQNTVNKIIETYENLAHFSDKGMPVQKYVSFPTEYRFILADNYSVFYRIENNSIRVIRILYSRSDFIRILFKDIDKDTVCRT
ncbi:type II toxin-antitoxin system RelE/ParE family toxin [Treponema sp. HNW]|uniref:type II toxin-antitoxin system RelE/ParE family toxin n=1 Tax=Treponema sp. HNW TaxID=3116654 RepID=UPI003D0F4E2A